MEDLASQSFNLGIGKRLLIIVVFLTLLWFLLDFVAKKIKAGEFKISDSLMKKFTGSLPNSKEIHKIEFVQKKYLSEGCELLVINVDGRDLLLAKGLNGSISFIKELDG